MKLQTAAGGEKWLDSWGTNTEQWWNENVLPLEVSAGSLSSTRSVCFQRDSTWSFAVAGSCCLDFPGSRWTEQDCLRKFWLVSLHSAGSVCSCSSADLLFVLYSEFFNTLVIIKLDITDAQSKEMTSATIELKPTSHLPTVSLHKVFFRFCHRCSQQLAAPKNFIHFAEVCVLVPKLFHISGLKFNFKSAETLKLARIHSKCFLQTL